MASSIQRPPVYRIPLVQFALTIAIALVSLFHSQEAAISALAGGLISLIPNAYFVYLAFRHSGAQQISQVLNNLYKGGAWKMVLRALGFALVFKLLNPLNITALFAGFLLVQASNLSNAKIANL